MKTNVNESRVGCGGGMVLGCAFYFYQLRASKIQSPFRPRAKPPA